MSKIPESSEQVEVSASKLQLILENHARYKEEKVKEIACLEAQLRSKDAQIQIYKEALSKLQNMKMIRNPTSNTCGSKKIMEEINKAKQFEQWYVENKTTLVEKIYTTRYKQDVDDLREQLGKLFPN